MGDSRLICLGDPSMLVFGIRRHLQWHPLTCVRFGSEVLHQSHSETTLQIGLDGVLSVRLREGYTIKRVRFVNGENIADVVRVIARFACRSADHVSIPWRTWMFRPFPFLPCRIHVAILLSWKSPSIQPYADLNRDAVRVVMVANSYQ